jgi:hypothetical protein
MSENKILSWESCVGICTHDAPSVVGFLRGFASLVQKGNPDFVTTHRFIQTELLVAKTLGDEMNKVLDDATKLINFIKQGPVCSTVL